MTTKIRTTDEVLDAILEAASGYADVDDGDAILRGVVMGDYSADIYHALGGMLDEVLFEDGTATVREHLLGGKVEAAWKARINEMRADLDKQNAEIAARGKDTTIGAEQRETIEATLAFGEDIARENEALKEERLILVRGLNALLGRDGDEGDPCTVAAEVAVMVARLQAKALAQATREDLETLLEYAIATKDRATEELAARALHGDEDAIVDAQMVISNAMRAQNDG